MIYDINLLPKSKKKTSIANLAAGLALVSCCVLVMIIFGGILPASEKSKLSKKVEEQKKELEAYSEIELQYQLLLTEQQEKQQLADTLDKLNNNNMKFSELLDDIEKNLPEDVYMKEIAFKDGLLTIDAFAPDYEAIAQFMVKTRKIKNVLGGAFLAADRRDWDEINSLLNAEEKDKIGKKPTNPNVEEEDGLHEFNMYLVLDTTNILTELQNVKTPETTTDAGVESEGASDGGEEANNATN